MGYKKLVVELEEELKEAFKVRMLEKRISMSSWVKDRISEYLNETD